MPIPLRDDEDQVCSRSAQPPRVPVDRSAYGSGGRSTKCDRIWRCAVGFDLVRVNGSLSPRCRHALAWHRICSADHCGVMMQRQKAKRFMAACIFGLSWVISGEPFLAENGWGLALGEGLFGGRATS